MKVPFHIVLRYSSVHTGCNSSTSAVLSKQLASALAPISTSTYRRDKNTRVFIRQDFAKKYKTMATSGTTNKRIQPPWAPPARSEADEPKLMLYNSLSRKKEEFIPQDASGRRVTWYNCGPTVYDASHMGHARTYLTFDIVRRVIQNYFGYDVFYVMNITDIDDKIIKRARQNYLYDNFVAGQPPLEKVISTSDEALRHFQGVVETTTDPDKRAMQERLFKKLQESALNLSSAVESGNPEKIELAKSQLLLNGKDLISDLLDKQHGSKVTDNAIFAKLPTYWEEQFHLDMESLNVLPADCLTRVSEYIPECVSYIQKIIERGYAYESNGSVYFNVSGFDASKDHYYAKLVPEAFGDQGALQEGEGDLSGGADQMKEKKSENDFALWKVSKPGEPSWDSPWGKGRPGWHIECSVMASSVLGKSIDIHTGGYDLKFPHHDNELAQSEAYFDNDNWIRYFLHSGHLTIAGCKMSKSLKNFITIQEVLQKVSARQLRIVFLLHAWKDTLDYSENTLELAKTYEKKVNELFLQIKHIMRTTPSHGVAAFQKWNEEETELNEQLRKCKEDVHRALCDNIDTRTVLMSIQDLVVNTNQYIEKNRASKMTKDSTSNQLSAYNRGLLKGVALFITNIFDVLGINAEPEKIGFATSGKESGNTEDIVMPYLDALALFRDDVRLAARSIGGDAVPILKKCDELRDDVLPLLGVRLEDKENEPTVIKLVDKEELMKEKEEKRIAEEKKREEKEKKKALEKAKQAELEAKKKIHPSEYFKTTEFEGKFSKFDEKGMPTHDAKGEELPKSQLKKLLKLHQAQEKRYNEYVATNSREG